MRIQSLFRNVPNSGPSLVTHSPFPTYRNHFGVSTTCFGTWCINSKRPCVVPWLVMGNHLQLLQMCTWLVLKHLLGYTQLLRWVRVPSWSWSSLLRAFQVLLEATPWIAQGDKKEGASAYPDLARVSSKSLNFPASQTQEANTSLGILPLTFRESGCRSRLKVPVKQICY